MLFIITLAHNCSLPEDLRNEGGQLLNLLVGSMRFCTVEEGSSFRQAKLVFPDSSGRL